jgi:chaperonin GroES
MSNLAEGEFMIKPLYDKIVVKEIEKKEEKLGSLYIPDSAKEKSSEGEVIAVGEGLRFEDKILPLKVKVGDIVIYDAYSVTPIKIDGIEYLVLKEQNILGVKE